MQNNIILITDSEKTAEEIKSKILLLRTADNFGVINYENCLEGIKAEKPVLILYHLNNGEEDFLNLVQKIRQNADLKTTSIILLLDKADENLLCSAFEKGVTDFMMTNASDSEFTIRTLWGLQKREKQNENENKKDILTQLKIIDKKNHVYTENYTYTILKEESKKNWGTFVVIAPDINIRSKIAPEELMNTIKKNVRTCDILGYASDFKIYLWFRQTLKDNVLNILEKIKTSLTADFTICAGYIETKDLAFDRAEELANKALSKALLKGSTFIYAQEPKKKEINLELSVKNFKLHKQSFLEKLEKILSPLFYQTQKRNEEKLFETVITQSVSEEKSFFRLKNEKTESLFNISYPGYTKINVQISHKINNEEEKKEKLYMETNEFTEEKIEYLLNSFIRDFQTHNKD